MKQDRIEIKRATPHHVPAIARFWAEFTSYHYDFDPLDNEGPTSREAYKSYLLTLVEDEECEVLVALRQGRVLGYCVGRAGYERMMYQLLRRPVHRIRRYPWGNTGSDIGAALFIRMQSWFRDRGEEPLSMRKMYESRSADFIGVKWEERTEDFSWALFT